MNPPRRGWGRPSTLSLLLAVLARSIMNHNYVAVILALAVSTFMLAYTAIWRLVHRRRHVDEIDPPGNDSSPAPSNAARRGAVAGVLVTVSTSLMLTRQYLGLALFAGFMAVLIAVRPIRELGRRLGGPGQTRGS